MVKPFPVRESSILSAAELVTRLLGLWFLARFVSTLGLQPSASFRILLPLVGVAAAFGSIGLPQALTRLFATTAAEGSPIPRTSIITAWQATVCAMLATGLFMQLFSHLAGQGWFAQHDEARLLRSTYPLLMLVCMTGSLRGMLFGLGSTYAPALASVAEVGTRVLVLSLLPKMGGLATTTTADGARLGLLTLTIGEAVAGCFLLAMFLTVLRRRRLDRARRRDLITSQLRRLLNVLRMSLASTGQSLLASLGYALELPLAQQLLTPVVGFERAEALIAEYAAIAVSLLCAPMVLTDGMATALLPVAASERARSGVESFALYLRRAIGITAMVAFPACSALLVLAPYLTTWFGAASASQALLLLAPLTLPLYLQAPLASLLQAQGRSRALLFAGLLADSARLFGLWTAVVHFGWQRGGLAFGFASSVLLQTGLLLVMAARLTPLSIPWRTISHAFAASLTLAALLLFAQHLPTPLSFPAHPVLWAGAALLALLLQYRLHTHSE